MSLNKQIKASVGQIVTLIHVLLLSYPSPEHTLWWSFRSYGTAVTFVTCYMVLMKNWAYFRPVWITLNNLNSERLTFLILQLTAGACNCKRALCGLCLGF